MADKDRRSKMENSSINEPPKKDGAGGNYTWGSPTDVQDFEAHNDAIQPGVQVVPQPDEPPPPEAEPFQLDQGQFPALGTTSARPLPTNWARMPATTTVTYGAPVMSTCTSPLSSVQYSSLRTGAVFDSTHPRNRFAAPPYKSVVTTAQVPQAIDWSDSGIPKQVVSSTIRGSENSAHLSPYAPSYGTPVSQVPMSVLTGQVKVQRQVFQQSPRYTPQLSQPVMKTMRQQHVIQQPQSRRGRHN
eukprot:gnl/TRDRNA2_/TRDRNA2_182847_c0_seq1.p1 gnl/TRDRNA2_/TRDRNA2_182847_c0~~gnl/TRDRNA2_/TRDRNA2_182847_c0_seq1.p1  ORF type:complete len:274 (+),score=35.00 gnl/TRDRNA2_/TRDRNA2_182847_c0_seq1:92-823(+)